MPKTYYPFLDLIRVCACFLVITLHLAAIKFYQFSPAWGIYVFYDSISRMCVPLFLMLSGFLLLDRPINGITNFYLARYGRIFPPCAMLAIIYYFTPLYNSPPPLDYILKILTNHLDYHLWYLYILIGIYFSLPFFMAILQTASGKTLAWLYLWVWLLAGVCAPFAARYSGWQVNIFTTFNFSFFTGFMGYLLCGWAIKQLLGRINGFWFIAIICFILATAGIIWGTLSLSYSLGRPDELFFENLTPLVWLQTISFFSLCIRFNRSSWVLRQLSDKAFWIYLIHALIVRVWVKLAPLPENNCAWIIMPLYASGVFICSFICACPLRILEGQLLCLLKRLKHRLCKVNANA